MADIIRFQPFFMSDYMNTTVTYPSIFRRFAACLYEFVLLFGIYFITGIAVQIVFTMIGQAAPTWVLQLVIFLAFGYYFVYSWTRSGQTLAQKTWHLQVTQLDGVTRLTTKQACLRYVFSYFGILPALMILYTQMYVGDAPTKDNMMVVYVQAIIFSTLNCLALLGTSLMNPDRRTIHELISNSRTIHVPSK